MSRRSLERVLADAEAAGFEHEAALARVWQAEVDWTWRDAAGRLERMGLTASWAMPIAAELLDSARVAGRMLRQTSRVRSRIVVAAGSTVARAYDAPWNVRNPLVQGVLEQQGEKITRIAETVRQDVMRQVAKGWEDGRSIPATARLIREKAPAMSRVRAATIARTETIQAVNGGSLAQVRILNASAEAAGEEPIARMKVWLATGDDRTRESHAAADGQAVPVDATFSVGADQLRYPGDPDGSAEEIINCRCTLTYE